MQIYRTDLNLLVVFECIYSLGSVTKAAEVLHLTQPTVSHALNRLRERVDDQLFVRNGQKLAPTPVAQNLIGPVRQALQLMETSLTDLEEFNPATASNSFSIGMRPLMEFAHFRPLNRLAQQQAPDITLSSVLFERTNLESELSSGNLSAAIDVYLPLPESINRELITKAQAVVVAREGHPAVKDGKLSLDEYLSQNHLIVSSRPKGQSVEDIILSKQGLKRKVSRRCQTLTTALEIVENSDLLLTIAETYLAGKPTTNLHQVCTAPFEAPDFEIYMYWHESLGIDKSNQWLRELIRTSYSSVNSNNHH